MNFLFTIANIIMWPVIRLLFRARCTGRENVPKKGAVIIAANHIHALDMFFISSFMPRTVRYLAKAELFKNPIIGFLFRTAGAIPIDRNATSAEPIKEVLSVLKKEKVVGIFPQGTRCKGKALRDTKVKNGVGMVAYHSGACVVPVLIEAKNMRSLPFRVTTVHFGKPICTEELGFTDGGMEEYRNASEYIFEKICDMSVNTFSGEETK